MSLRTLRWERLGFSDSAKPRKGGLAMDLREEHDEFYEDFDIGWVEILMWLLLIGVVVVVAPFFRLYFFLTLPPRPKQVAS